MNKIKSILALLLMASMLFALCACGAGSDKDTEKEEETKKPEITTVADTEPEEVVILTVKVVDNEGNAVEGAMVQLCNETNCFTAMVDSEGNAKFLESVVSEITANCYLTIPYMPEGYEFTSDNKVYLNDGDSEYTYTLNKVG